MEKMAMSKSGRKVIAFLLIIVLLTLMTLSGLVDAYSPIPSDLRTEITSVANGALVREQPVLYYNVGDLDAMYAYAKEKNFRLNVVKAAETAGFTDDVAAQFVELFTDTDVAGSENGFYIVDAVYSKRNDSNWPEIMNEDPGYDIEGFVADSSVAYVVRKDDQSPYQFITFTKHGEKFIILVDPAEQSTDVAFTAELLQATTTTDIQTVEVTNTIEKPADSTASTGGAAVIPDDKAEPEETENPADEAEPSESDESGAPSDEETDAQLNGGETDNNEPDDIDNTTDDSAVNDTDTNAGETEQSEAEQSTSAVSGPVLAVNIFANRANVALAVEITGEILESFIGDALTNESSSAPEEALAVADDTVTPETVDDETSVTETTENGVTYLEVTTYEEKAVEVTVLTSTEIDSKSVFMDVGVAGEKAAIQVGSDTEEADVFVLTLSVDDSNHGSFIAAVASAATQQIFTNVIGGLFDVSKNVVLVAQNKVGTHVPTVPSTTSPVTINGVAYDQIAYVTTNFYDYENLPETNGPQNTGYSFNAAHNVYTQTGVTYSFIRFGGDQNGAQGGYTGDPQNVWTANAVHQGIAAPTLTNGIFALNDAFVWNGVTRRLITNRGLNLFPTIADTTKKEVFIQADNTANGDQNQTAYQRYQAAGGMWNPTPEIFGTTITAYPDYKMPYLYNSTTHEYLFNSDYNHVIISDGKTDDERKLTLYNERQSTVGEPGQNNSVSGWYPFYGGRNIAVRGDAENYFFGMSAEISFAMPQDGNISYTNANGTKITTPMVFNFAGDDDFWVYVDNVLVLDIGGMHRSITGSINFNTGAVEVGGVAQTPLWNSMGTGLFPSKFADFGSISGDGTIVDKEHTVKLFYLERGAGDTNCTIKFNIPEIPNAVPGALNVVKLAEGANSNDKFSFDVYTSENSKDEQPDSAVYGSEADETKIAVNNISENGGFPVNIPPSGMWVRVVENPNPEGLVYDKFSTVWLKPATGPIEAVLTRSKDTGWQWYDAGTHRIFFTNYTQKPITVIKKGSSEEPLSGVTFKLEKANNSNGWDEIRTELTTVNGRVELNNTHLDAENALSEGKYRLTETSTVEGYRYNNANPTSLSFRIDATGNLVNGSKSELTGKAYLNAAANEIIVYNEKIQGSIAVTKVLTSEGAEILANAHGDATFLFRVEQFRSSDFTQEAIKSWVKEITYVANGTNTKLFTGLDWGYTYRVTELDATARYNLTDIKVDGYQVDVAVITLTVADVTENFVHEIEFTNFKTKNKYLSDTSVRTNNFLFAGGNDDLDDVNAVFHKVVYFNDNNQVNSDPISVKSGSFLLPDTLNLFTDKQLNGLAHGDWKVQVWDTTSETWVNAPDTDYTFGYKFSAPNETIFRVNIVEYTVAGG